jgi:Xaa-Pro aminopeptidase
VTSRLADLSAGLDERGCEALLVLARSSLDSDLSAFFPRLEPAHLGECLLVAPRGQAARLAYFTPMERDEAAATGLPLITPEELDILRWQNETPEPHQFLARAAARALELSGVSRSEGEGRLALAGNGQAGTVAGACAELGRQGWTLVPGNTLVLGVRKRKGAGELRAIRAAAEGVAEALRAVAGRLAAASERDAELWLEGERLKVGRLRAEVAAVFAARGLEQPRGNILAPGAEGGVPHSAGDPERALRPGETLVADVFPRGIAFADCTRTFCVGEPPEAVRRAWGAVRDALELARARAVPGTRGWDLQEAVCASLGAAGYATPISHPGTTVGYVHNLGHGVGFDLHEYPLFRKAAGAEGVLREGDVFTLEPGLYDPEAGYGLRLEDLVYLGPGGLENLTPLPYEMDPRAW